MDAKKSGIEALMAGAVDDMFALRDYVADDVTLPGHDDDLVFDVDAFASAALDAE